MKKSPAEKAANLERYRTTLANHRAQKRELVVKQILARIETSTPKGSRTAEQRKAQAIKELALFGSK